ncbi:hypothetical protein [Actinomadura rubrisoli]|uniref:Uncharacterized protein n=1 Tax=Actinomadura rubrisoli TaxID=2530368 RepID=A0A4R5B799_9ACTN|nr:hypothetical protein [Actinomadura rubrisoli]TDD79534.1 hypothetical protein E1298_27600 [Actinomadura rubrisoli]
MPATWDDDEQLFAALKEAVREAERVPSAFVQAGRAAYCWRGIDAELAELTFDSAAGADRRPALTRAEPASLRNLTWASSEMTLEVEIDEGTLLGQVVPPRPGEVDLYVSTDLVATRPVDEVGVFVIRPVPGAPFRLHYRSGAGSILTTWIRLP